MVGEFWPRSNWNESGHPWCGILCTGDARGLVYKAMTMGVAVPKGSAPVCSLPDGDLSASVKLVEDRHIAEGVRPTEGARLTEGDSLAEGDKTTVGSV